MGLVVIIKKILMGPLIRMIIKHPKIMKSKLFVKAMTVFPDKISYKYDQKIANMDIDYQAPLKEGLTFVHQEPDKVLDIATGTGVAALLAAKRFENATIEGLDLSSEMIKIAKSKAEEAGHTNITFKIGNAIKLDYQTSSEQWTGIQETGNFRRRGVHPWEKRRVMYCLI